MGKAHPIELRERVVDFVEEGNTHRASAAHFRVSVKFVNDMVRLKQESGSLQPKTQGHPGGSKLDRVEEWVHRRLYEKSALTLDELVVELGEHQNLKVHRSSVGRLLHRLGLSHKKDISGSRAETSGCGSVVPRVDLAPPAFYAIPTAKAGFYR